MGCWDVYCGDHDYKEKALDLLRIYLGIGLLVRGALFIGNKAMLTDWMASAEQLEFLGFLGAHYVIVAHLAGGLMLAVGLFTRLAALVQIPILLGAVFFVHLKDGLLSADQSLEFSALVLVLLVLYAAVGSGRWSVDYKLWGRSGE